MKTNELKELPLTRLHRAYKAKQDVVSLYPTIICMVGALLASALLSVFAESKSGFWISLIGIIIFGTLAFATIVDMIKNSNILAEKAIQNAWDFGTEYNDHDMTKFHLELERSKNPVPAKRSIQRPRSVHPDGHPRF